MMHSTQRVVFAAIALAFATPGSAQNLYRVYRSDTYVTLGGGSGNFTFTCDDPACAGGKRNSGEAALILGYHVRRRIRLEGTVHHQREGIDGNYLGTLSLGAAVYVWRNLHVRGAAAWITPSVGDATGAYDGRGTGFLGGAAYDLHMWHMLALTPFVNYASGSIPKVERTQVGGTVTTSPGKVTTMNFGLGLTFIGGAWECVSRSGQHFRIKRFRKMSSGARSCVNEVERKPNGSAQR